jgi:hypothetical protein
VAHILSKQRDLDVLGAFDAYRKYLFANRSRFPPSAFALANSDWYFDFEDHRCPHDSWLESAQISESAGGDRSEIRRLTLTVRLLGAYHDGHIELAYSDMNAYEFKLGQVDHGHGDWRYDEFRVSDAGRVVHEIEWASFANKGSWLIEASDVTYRWIPKSKT